MEKKSRDKKKEFPTRPSFSDFWNHFISVGEPNEPKNEYGGVFGTSGFTSGVNDVRTQREINEYLLSENDVRLGKKK